MLKLLVKIFSESELYKDLINTVTRQVIAKHYQIRLVEILKSAVQEIPEAEQREYYDKYKDKLFFEKKVTPPVFNAEVAEKIAQEKGITDP